ncbi:AAA domain-containing protein [Armatimonas sp.]|uniref:bifunctional RecB family nuclease/DEAD/DEAH box helicase n=1 Tax=Armatimonas sp. TaxID=1872638 RepID=UPI00374DDE06
MNHALPITNHTLTPTDVSQFIRLERCERYLRLRMYERSRGNQKFLYEFDVQGQDIPPMLGRSGASFEAGIVEQLAAQVPLQDFAKDPVSVTGKRHEDNERVVAAAEALAPGERQLIAQPRLREQLGHFAVRGDADLVLLERGMEGALSLLIIDIKSSAAPHVEHRLQVAFYAAILGKLLPDAVIETAILYKGPAQAATPEEQAKLDTDRLALTEKFGTAEGYLERILNGAAYQAEVEALVSAESSVAARVAHKDAADLSFALGLKCDGCLFNEYCMKKTVLDGDVAQLPYLSTRDRNALRRAGVRTLPELAGLKEPVTEGKWELKPTSPEAVTTLRKLAGTTVAGRVDELVLRAKRNRLVGEPSPSTIPDRGHGTLPYSDAELHPNLIQIYVEAQYDYLVGRAYLLAALVIANKDGKPHAQQHIVHFSEGPPDTTQKEAQLFAGWIRETLAAVVALADGDEAPIHLIFWNDYGQKTLLEALSRNIPAMVAAAPALYDFLTQIAAYDSPTVTFLAEEIRAYKNYPMLCQSLPLVATYLKFDWTDAATGDVYKKLFHAHLFDNGGKLEDGTPYARRSRHNSQLPLEYAYAAWDQLPTPEPGKTDRYGSYRAITREQLTGFSRMRLDAIAHIAKDLPKNRVAFKSSFRLPDLATYENRAETLAGAIDEFLRIERATFLADWQATHRMAPERRAATGASLLVTYRDSDQEDGGVQLQDCRERQRLYDEWREGKPKGARRPKDVMEKTDWSYTGLAFRLRITTEGTDADLDTILGMLTVKEGEYRLLAPRWSTYGQEEPYTTTPKQLLRAARVAIKRFQIKRDENGRAVEALAEVEGKESRGKSDGIYVYDSYPLLPEEEELYTLDADPSNIMGQWAQKLTDGLSAAEAEGNPGVHTFYRRLAQSDLTTPAEWPEAAADAQNRFLEGLDAFHAAGLFHDFEPGKREFIGTHGGDPILLVQGPPGTGKSYSSGFAILARIQGAMAAQLPQRVFLSCKTHSATDVLLGGVREAVEKLESWHQKNPTLYKQFFETRLLDLPFVRLDPEKPIRWEEEPYLIVAGTPGGIWKLRPKDLFSLHVCDLLVLDEASQMSLPEALMASLLLKPGGRVIVVGDPRQMPPIVQHAWDTEARRTFDLFPTYRSLFDFLSALNPPYIRFTESFRLHQVMAEFLREEIYRHDGIHYHSHRTSILAAQSYDDPLVEAVLSPDYPLIVVIHDEAESQSRNSFEEKLLGPILAALTDSHKLGAEKGLGVVVPHRAQRSALQLAYPQLCVLDDNGQVILSAVDTVERYQGDERDVIVISATESDPDYIQASAGFLLDPCRLNVALSRAKKKMVLVASRSIFEYFSADEEMFRNAQIWKNLLRRTCRIELYQGELDGKPVAIYGCPIPQEINYAI